METLLKTKMAGIEPKRGKVRDIYELGDKLLIVATDRLSAFDVVMKTGIPYKDKVLTQISKFWFEFFGSEFEHHYITDDVGSFPEPFCDYAEFLNRDFPDGFSKTGCKKSVLTAQQIYLSENRTATASLLLSPALDKQKMCEYAARSALPRNRHNKTAASLLFQAQRT